MKGLVLICYCRQGRNKWLSLSLRSFYAQKLLPLLFSVSIFLFYCLIFACECYCACNKAQKSTKKHQKAIKSTKKHKTLHGNSKGIVVPLPYIRTKTSLLGPFEKLNCLDDLIYITTNKYFYNVWNVVKY